LKERAFGAGGILLAANRPSGVPNQNKEPGKKNIAPSSLAFLTVGIGTPKNLTLTIKNTARGPNLEGAVLTLDAPFAVTEGSGAFNIMAGLNKKRDRSTHAKYSGRSRNQPLHHQQRSQKALGDCKGHGHWPRTHHV
jgi:hypothetical protein